MRDTQIALETQWLDEGADNFRASLSNSPFSSTCVGNYLLGKSAKDMEAALERMVDTMVFKNLIQKAVWLLLSPREMATIALKYLLDVSFSQHPGFPGDHL